MGAGIVALGDSMTNQQAQVFHQLVQGGMYGVSVSSIATYVHSPEPSIRRTIQELIRLGHNISFASDGLYYYRKGY